MKDDAAAERVTAEQADFPPAGTTPKAVDMSGLELWMLGHAHIDLGYRWDLSETIHRIAPWTFRGVLRMMDTYPEFVFAQSQMFLYHAMEQAYPAVFDRIHSEIEAGRWDVVGGAWAEYDTALTSGESIIRQHLYGVQYSRERLGVESADTAFVPDSFIYHPRSLPAILSGCGFRYYLFGRGLPQHPDRPEDTRRAFRWRAPDGNELIAYLPFGPYSNGPMTAQHLAELGPYVPAGVSKQELALFGTGDHGGGPREPDFEALAELHAIDGAPSWRYGKLSDYMKTAFTPEVRGTLTTHEESLRAFATGALTSQAQIKRANRRLEKHLQGSEALATIATMLQRKPAYPRVDFQEMWRTLLTYQFHDILPGTSVASVYRRANEAYTNVSARLTATDKDSTVRVGSRIDTTRVPGHPFVVVNPTCGPVSAVVKVKIPRWLRKRVKKSFHVFAVPQAGAEARVLVPDAHVRKKSIVLSTDLPSLGYRTFTIAPGSDDKGPGNESWYSFEGRVFETKRYRIEFSKTSGDVLAVVDKATDKDILRGPSNTLELWGEHELATSWVHVLDEKRTDIRLKTKPKPRKKNPLYATVTTKSRTDSSTFKRSVTVYRDLDRIDFELKIDWHEPSSFLKIGFRPAFPVETVRTAIPYGRETVADPSREFLMHEWVDLEGSDRGCTIVNDGAYGADVVDGELRISVIRNVRDMDPSMSFGRHVLRYAVVPRPDGSFVRSQFQPELNAFLSPPLAAWTGRHPGGLKSWGTIDTSAPLPPDHSFLNIDNPSVAIETFKMPDEAYTPEGFVIRLRELDGALQRFVLTLPHPVSRAIRTDHLERPIDDAAACGASGDTVTGEIKPYELATIVAYI